MKKLIYLSLILVSVSPVAHGANWFSRLFGFGGNSSPSDADQASHALAGGDPISERRNAYIADALHDLPERDRQDVLRDVAKHNLVQDSALNEERAKQIGEYRAREKWHEYQASPGFFARLPGRASAGALDGFQEVIAQATAAGTRIACNKAIETYQEKNFSPEKRAYYEGLKKLQEETEEIDKKTLLLNVRAELIKSKFAQEAAQKELEKLEKVHQEHMKKKTEAEAKAREEAEMDLKVAIAEQQGSVTA
ncbi:MAG: hypothetical protein ACHQVS_01505 [Candidatus Babeliales bacterium]